MGYYDDSIPSVAKLWSYALQNALADNYFDSVMGDAPPDVLQMVAARDTVDHTSVQPFYGPCNKPDARATALTYKNLADQLAEKSIGWGWFQEALGACGNFVPQENPFQYFTSTHDSPNIQEMGRFSERLLDGTLPSVSFVQPGPGKSTHPGSGVTVAVGLNWLDEFIRGCQKSPAWSTMAIVVVWDEPGGWYDHVPPPQTVPAGYGMRVPMLVISPYAKQGYISHTFMDHVSILKFIQWNWGLDPLNQRNQSAGDMREMFTF
jgi:phospholipase C